MNLKDLKYYIADALQRDISSFVSGEHDSLALAVSNGMRSLQRQHDFEMCRTYGFVNFVGAEPWKISTLIDAYDEDDMQVKRFERAYYVNQETGETTPIRMVGREYLWNKDTERAETNSLQYTSPLVVVRFGKVFYLHQIPDDYPETIRIRFDVVRWLPELAGSEVSNFITEVAPDVLIYHALAELNLFLKEDERAPLSQSFYNARWETLKKWDADQFENTQQDIFLD